MKVIQTAIPDLLILEPKVFGDQRGFFLESYNQQACHDFIGIVAAFVRDNYLRSSKNTLKGLHYLDASELYSWGFSLIRAGDFYIIGRKIISILSAKEELELSFEMPRCLRENSTNRLQ